VSEGPTTIRWKLGVTKFRREMIRLGNEGTVPMLTAIQDCDRYELAVDPLKRVTFLGLDVEGKGD
jgi:hypothetical protein